MAQSIQRLLTILVVLVALPLTAFAQEGAVTGTVEDAKTGETLPGVQVVIAEVSMGAVTNSDGVYEISGVPAGTYTLEARFVGFRANRKEVEVQSGETATVSFRLRESAVNLNEVVVTGAGGAVEKRKLGNTISTIDAENLESMPVQNVSEIIQGREPGLSGLPSGGLASEGSRIRIRGSASLSQSNEPLVYVDGVRANNGGGFGGGFVGTGGGGSPSRLDDINPLAIQRVEVLKGAAAATLFGTQASNGVLQIFTKQGKIGPPQFNFQMTQSGSVFPDAYPDQTGFAGSQAQADVMSDVIGQDIQPYEIVRQNVPEALSGTGQTQSYAGSVSGGAEGIRYFVSARVEDNDGPFEPTFFRNPDYPEGIDPLANDAVARYQGTARVDITPSDKLSLRVTTGYTDSQVQSLQTNNNIYGIISLAQFSKPELVAPNNRSGTVAFATVNESLRQSVEQETKHFNGSGNITYRPIEQVTFDTKFGVDFTNSQNTEFRPFGWNIDNFASDTPDGERSFADVNQLELTLDSRVNGSAQLSEQFTGDLTTGIQGFVSRGTLESGNGFDFPGPGFEVTDAAANTAVLESFSEVINGGIFAEGQVGYNDYVFLTVGTRYDANSAFGSDFSGVLYPKASVSFIPSDAPFWENDVGPISSLRFRSAVGQSGLQPGAFDALTTFSSLSSRSGPGIVPDNLGNPELEPEIATEWEVGLELGLFNDRFGMEGTYWNRTVDQALVSRQFPVTGGFRATQLSNIGQLDAQGVEIALDATVLDRDDVSIDVFANTAYLYEQVSDLGGAPPIKVGGSYPRYRNYIVEGFAPGTHFGVQLQDTPEGTLPVDLNGDGNPDSRDFLVNFLGGLTPSDLGGALPGSAAMPSSLANVLIAQNPDSPTGDPADHFLGKPTPDFSGSFGFDVGFLDNFQVSTLFEYKAGNFYVNNLTDAFRNSNPFIGRNTPEASQAQVDYLTGGLDGSGNPQNSGEVRVEALETWINDLLALAPFSGLNTVERADFVRWRELALTYNVPQSLTEQFRIRNLSLTLAGRNLALFTPYSGVDPELNAVGRGSGSSLDQNYLTGVEAFGFPIPRRFEFRMQLGF